MNYLIAFTPRSGSTYLCQLLTANGLGQPTEYFQKPLSFDNKRFCDSMTMKSTDFIGYVNHLISTFSRNGIFGAKIAWTQQAAIYAELNKNTFEAKWIEQLLSIQKWLFVTRRDKLSQAVSMWRAIKSERWHSPDMHTGDLFPDYCHDEIRDCLHLIFTQEYLWNQFFKRNNIIPHTVIYEDLLKDPLKQIQDLSIYIGHSLKGNISLQTNLKILRDEYSEEIKARFTEDLSRWTHTLRFLEQLPMKKQTETLSFHIDRDGNKLPEILDTIDERMRQNEATPNGHQGKPESAVSQPVSSNDSDDKQAVQINALRRLQAPYFILTGKLLSKVAYLMNIPLFVFGRKQAMFNRQVTDILADNMTQNAADPASMSAVKKEMEAIKHNLHATATIATGTEEWLRIVAAKQARMALQLREVLAPNAMPRRDSKATEPRIVNQQAFEQKLEVAKGAVAVNIGCGEKPRQHYINVDRDELPGVDVIADACNLPFEKGTIHEIMSEHLVEHFREQQLRQTIIPYWKSLLSSDGCLRIICPNWQAMLDQLQTGEMRYEHFKKITFGAQDYEGDDHFSMYTPESLTALLNDCGFPVVDVVATGRMNGGCPEMELVAFTATRKTP